jgi:hypothetical protein
MEGKGMEGKGANPAHAIQQIQQPARTHAATQGGIHTQRGTHTLPNAALWTMANCSERNLTMNCEAAWHTWRTFHC